MDRRTFIAGSAASIVLAAAGALVGCAPRKSVDALSCDVFKIEPVEAYPHDYSEMLPRAQSEQDGDARPAIANIAGLPSIAAYDTVLVGSGIWWGKPPMIMRTFLESFDFSGKTIIPFTTNGGSGLGTAVEDYSRLCPSATVSSNGLAVLGEDVAKDETRQRVEQWARLL